MDGGPPVNDSSGAPAQNIFKGASGGVHSVTAGSREITILGRPRRRARFVGRLPMGRTCPRIAQESPRSEKRLVNNLGARLFDER
jgi:hypothetical protein